MKNLPPKAPTCKELNPQAPKHARSSCQGDPDQTPLETLTAKNQPAADPTPGSTCPSTDPPKSKRFKMMARKGAKPVLASCSPNKASVPHPSPKYLNETTTPHVSAKSATRPEGEPVKPSPPPEATVEADRGEDADSYFASIMKRTTPAASEAPDGATSSAIDPPPTAEEIKQAKRTFMSFLHMSFSEILGSSETFSKTLNTLVRSSGIGDYVQLALQLFKHAFPSLSKTYDSTKQSKAVVDNQLQQADDLCAKLNQCLECYQNLKTEEEDAQSEKKAIKDKILLLEVRLTQLDDKLTDLSSQKEVLYQTTMANRTAYKKLEGELPLLSFMKSNLEVELAEIEKTWVNFRSTFGSRVQNS